MIKHNAIFLIDKELDREDGKLRYRIKWDGGVVAFGVGFRVDLNKWSKDTQRCKTNTTHGPKKIAANVINKEITRFENIAEEVFNIFEIAGKKPSAEEFRHAFNTRIGKASKSPVANDKNFFEVYREFTKEVGFTNTWADATYQKFDALKNHITSFNEKISFNNFNENELSRFVAHLRDNRNLRNSTIGKQLGFLKWFLRWATAKGYNSEQAFLSFSPKLKTAEKKVIFLDWEELMIFWNKDIPDNMPGLSRVRDVFCFCCFTGLRYSDVANLKRSDIFKTYISVTTVKTNDSINVDLNNYSRFVLNKYQDETFPGNRALPVISNQKMNQAIKDLGKLCKIEKPVRVTYYKGNKRIDEVVPKYTLLGTHAGRRTFICNALMLGIAPQVVMKWTGHSDYKAMKPYIDIADKAKADAMKLFNK